MSAASTREFTISEPPKGTGVNKVRHLAFHPEDSATLVTASEWGVVELWNVSDLSCLGSYTPPAGQTFGGVAFSESEESVLALGHSKPTGGAPAAIVLANSADMSVVRTMEADVASVESLDWLSGGGRIVSGNDYSCISLWDADGRGEIWRFKDYKLLPRYVTQVRHCGQRGYVVTSGNWNGSGDGIVVWRVEPSRLMPEYVIGPISVRALSFDDVLGVLVIGAVEGVYFWNIEERTELFDPLPGSTASSVRDLDVVSGKMAIAGNNGVTLWDLVSRSCMCRIRKLRDGTPGLDPVHAVAFSSNGRRLALGTQYGGVVLFDVDTLMRSPFNIESTDGLLLDAAPIHSSGLGKVNSRMKASDTQEESARSSAERPVLSYRSLAGEQWVRCSNCGTINRLGKATCGQCDSRMSEDTSAPDNYEYGYYRWHLPPDAEPDCVWAREGWPTSDAAMTLRQRNEVEARVHFWQKYQHLILDDFRKWEDAGWSPVTEVGASSVELERGSSRSTSLLVQLARAIIYEQWCFIGVTIKVRRRKT